MQEMTEASKKQSSFLSFEKKKKPTTLDITVQNRPVGPLLCILNSDLQSDVGEECLQSRTYIGQPFSSHWVRSPLLRSIPLCVKVKDWMRWKTMESPVVRSILYLHHCNFTVYQPRMWHGCIPGLPNLFGPMGQIQTAGQQPVSMAVGTTALVWSPWNAEGEHHCRSPLHFL